MSCGVPTGEALSVDPKKRFQVRRVDQALALGCIGGMARQQVVQSCALRWLHCPASGSEKQFEQ